MTRPKLVLASASPRRSECLRQLGLNFLISPADISEQLNPEESSSQYVERLSREKATKVQGECPGAIVIGGDTIVWTGKEILGKPINEKHVLYLLNHKPTGNSYHYLVTGSIAPLALLV